MDTGKDLEVSSEVEQALGELESNFVGKDEINVVDLSEILLKFELPHKLIKKQDGILGHHDFSLVFEGVPFCKDPTLLIQNYILDKYRKKVCHKAKISDLKIIGDPYIINNVTRARELEKLACEHIKDAEMLLTFKIKNEEILNEKSKKFIDNKCKNVHLKEGNHLNKTASKVRK